MKYNIKELPQIQLTETNSLKNIKNQLRATDNTLRVSKMCLIKSRKTKAILKKQYLKKDSKLLISNIRHQKAGEKCF